MSKLLLGIMIALAFVGCDKSPEVAEPTVETTPWLFPEPLIKQLTSADFRARGVAAIGLGNMGAKAEAAIPELEKLLEDENPNIRKVVKEALEKIRADLG